MSRYLALFTTALIVTLSFYLPLQTADESRELTFAAALCLTGECAEWGENSLKGAQLAVEEINARGGILGHPVSLHIEDTAEGSGGAKAVSAFNAILQTSEAKFIIGPSWTSGGMALAPLIKNKEDILVISPSLGVAAFNETADNIFNTWPHDSIATIALAEYAWNNGWRKGVVLSSQQPWEKLQADTFARKFNELGGVIKSKIEFMQKEDNFRSSLIKILAEQIDFVIFANFQSMDIAARALAQLGYSGPKLAVLMDNTRIENAQGALENCIYASYPAPAAEFVDLYKKRFGETPGISADTAYDSVMLVAKAIADGGSFKVTDIRQIISSQKYIGASGTLKFDRFGGVMKTPVLYIVQSGNGKPV